MTDIEVWADNATGVLGAPCSPGATTLSVSTSSGTFPTPTGSEVFHLIIDFDTVVAETVKITANSSGVFTVAAPGTANAHDSAAPVALVITTAGLNNLTDESILRTIITSAGDLVAGTGAATVERLGKGTSGQVLSVGGADPSGLEWSTLPASFPPSGSAGGDLSGTYPDPTVSRVDGVDVSGTPSSGQLLTALSGVAATWANPPGPAGAAGGDLGGTYPDPTVEQLQGAITLSGTPATGEVLTATGSGSANWQAPPGGAPTGPAGGDLSGSYPDPSVEQLQGSIALSGTPSAGQVLTATSSSSADWATPSGSVDAAAIEATFTAAGQLYAGTGSGTGEQLAIGSSGQVLTVGGVDPSGLEWATPSGGGGGDMTYYEASTTGSISAPNGNTTLLTTPSLAVGNYLVSISGLVEIGGTAACVFYCQQDSGVGTLVGPYYASTPAPATASTVYQVATTFILEVTSPGTFDFKVYNNDATSATVLSAVPGVGGLTTGYTITLLVAGVTPSGSAGGDLGGTYPDPTVEQLQGAIVLSGTPTSGQVLTATSGSAADWQNPAGGALTSYFYHPSSDVNLASGNTLINTTPSLALGTYLISMTGFIVVGGTDNTTLYFNPNSGSGTMEGPSSVSTPNPGTATNGYPVATTFLLVVTSAGTFDFKAYNEDVASAILAHQTPSATTPTSGYIIVQIA